MAGGYVMSVYFTAGYEAATALPLAHPRILWRSWSVDTIVSSGDAEGHPADRVVVPDTSTWWQSTTGDLERTLTLDFGVLRLVDAVGLGRHNCGGQEVLIEGATDAGLTTWTTLDTLEPEDDSSILALVTPDSYYGIRITITVGDADVATEIGVVYAGVALVIPVRGYGDLGPIDLGMDVDVNTYRTETGQLAGRFVDYTGLRGSILFTHLTEAWVRVSLIPFLKFAITKPFFIATRPSAYPTDCAFAWTTKNVIPQRMKMKTYMSVQMEVHAHAPSSLF